MKEKQFLTHATLPPSTKGESVKVQAHDVISRQPRPSEMHIRLLVI